MSLPMKMCVMWTGLALCAASPTGCADGAKSERKAAKDADDQAFALGATREPTARTLHALASVLAGKGRDDEARVVLMRVVHEHPQYLPAYNDLASLHLREDRPDDARAVLTAGLNIQPTDPVLINNLGMCHLHTKDYGAALEHFERAASLDPGSDRYRGNQALALAMLGDYDRSFEVYRTFLEEDEAHDNVALIARTHPVHPPEGNTQAQ